MHYGILVIKKYASLSPKFQQTIYSIFPTIYEFPYFLLDSKTIDHRKPFSMNALLNPFRDFSSNGSNGFLVGPP